MNSSPKTPLISSSTSSLPAAEKQDEEEHTEKPRSLLKRAAEYFWFGSSFSSQKKKARVEPSGENIRQASAATVESKEDTWVSPLARDTINTPRDSSLPWKEQGVEKGTGENSHPSNKGFSVTSQQVRDSKEIQNLKSDGVDDDAHASKTSLVRGEVPPFSIGSSTASSRGGTSLALNRRRIQFAPNVKSPAPSRVSQPKRVGTPYYSSKASNQMSSSAGSASFASSSGLTGTSTNKVRFHASTVTTPLPDRQRRQYYKTPIFSRTPLPHTLRHEDGDDGIHDDQGSRMQREGQSESKTASNSRVTPFASHRKPQYKATSRILALPARTSLSLQSPSSASKLSCISAQTISSVASQILEKQSMRYSSPQMTNGSDSTLFSDPTSADQVSLRSRQGSAPMVMDVKRVYGSHQTGSRVGFVNAVQDSTAVAGERVSWNNHASDQGVWMPQQQQQEKIEQPQQQQQQPPAKRKKVSFTNLTPPGKSSNDMSTPMGVGSLEEHKRMPSEATPYKSIEEDKVYIVSTKDHVDHDRDVNGKSTYPHEYMYGKKMEIGSGSNGVVATDVTKKVLEKLENGLLHGYVKFSKKRKYLNSPPRTNQVAIVSESVTKLPYDFMPKIKSTSRKGSSSILNKPLNEVLAKRETEKPSNQTTQMTSDVSGITSSEKPVEDKKGSSSGWGDLFASNAGQWKCETCMLPNQKDAVKCVACETPKGGESGNVGTNKSRASEIPGTNISFGTSTTESSKQGSAAPKFTFGAPKSDENGKVDSSTTSGKFVFGQFNSSETNSHSVNKPTSGGFVFGSKSSAEKDNSDSMTLKKDGPVFGFTANTNDKPSAGGFTFGGFSKDSSDTNVKDSAQTSGGTFTFGGTAKADDAAAEKSYAPPTSGGFTFGASKTNDAAPDKSHAQTAPGGFIFGGASKTSLGASNEKGDVQTTSTGLSSGGASKNELNGEVDAEKSDAKPSNRGFSFGSSNATGGLGQPSAGGFVFGGTPKTTTGSDGDKADTQPSAGSFSFGMAAKSATTTNGQNGEAAIAAGGKNDTQSNAGGFTFGGATKTTADVKSSGTSFAFGASSSSATGEERMPPLSVRSIDVEPKKESIPNISFSSGSGEVASSGVREHDSSLKPKFSFGVTNHVTNDSLNNGLKESSSESAPKPMFSFGSASSSSNYNQAPFGDTDALSKNKRSADESATQPTAPTFTFGSSSSIAPVSSNNSFATGLNQSTSATATTDNKPMFSFGSSGTQSTSAIATTDSKPAFSFGSSGTPAAAPNSSFNFGSSAPTASAIGAMSTQTVAPPNNMGFSFGSTPNPSQGATFSFGSTPAPAPTPSSQPFSFGTGSASVPAPAPFGAPAMPATTSSSGFSFGQPQMTAAPGAVVPFGQAPAPAFGFGGAPASTATTTPSTLPQFGAPGAQPSMPMGGAGGFSIGTGGGNKNKAGRRIIRAKRPPAR